MDQTNGIDKSKPLIEQVMQLLKKRFALDFEPLGGENQYFKKVAAGVIALTKEEATKQNSLLVEALEKIVKMTPSFTNIEAIKISESALRQYRKGE